MRKVNIRGKEFQVTENQNLFWDKVEAGLWEPETFEVLDQFIEKDKTFIDIGAWNGVCTMYAQSKGAKVETIEPDESIYDTLVSNIGSNVDEYTVYECAISDQNGLLNLKSIGSFGDSMSSLIGRSDKEQSKEVETYTLETFIGMTQTDLTYVCLIKMDIEGGEVLVFKQAKEFLSTYKPTIYISLHPAWFPNPKDDMQMIIDVIFPIYKVCRMIDGVVTQYSRDRFVEAVERGEHSYILIAK